jgi:anthranilate phosphoribosyltransferase
MSHAFRTLLKKIASGPHTGQHLSRQEAEAAMMMVLQAEATPAQIGGFIVAHRMKRPVPEELAGILDAYDRLSQRIPALNTQPSDHLAAVPIVLGCPYDGRARTAPVTPIVALLLANAGVPVVMHGGDRMPTKYGLPVVEIWQALGIDWTTCDVTRLSETLDRARLACAYTPLIFPETIAVADYRDQIGKRPPLATIELMWSPYAGAVRHACGFVHPPTEGFFQGAFALRGQSDFITVKGLEGSCDLPRSRTAIIGCYQGDQFGRLHLHARDFGLGGSEAVMDSEADYLADLTRLIAGQIETDREHNLLQSAIWSGGFFLWQSGVSENLTSGIRQAEQVIRSGALTQTIATIQAAIQAASPVELTQPDGQT